MRGTAARLEVTAHDPIASTHVLPRDVDSRVERHLVRDVLRLGSTWTIERETSAIRAGRRVFFPDFTLARGGDRVTVEIVGYYTPEYLTSKLRCLREAGLSRMIVCIDEALACGDDEVCATRVLRYRRRVDARELLALADAIVR